VPAQGAEPLELDELWSFVARRTDKRWVWLALCRRTRQVVAYCTGRPGRRHRQPGLADLLAAVGAHPGRLQDGPALHGLLARLPEGAAPDWHAYQKVLPPEQHRASGKGEGQTNHVERFNVERFNNVLRQRSARFVRKTLSFSKIDAMHEDCLRLFLHEYNQPTWQQPKRIRLY